MCRRAVSSCAAAAFIVGAAPALAEIVPRDGTWTVRTVETEMAEECPPMFGPMADGMAATLGRRETYEVEWNGAFDPNRASGLNPDGQPLVWERVDEATWQAVLSGPGTDFVIGRMRIRSETEIANRVDMDVEKAMEQQGGAIDAEGCTLSMSFTMEHKG